MGARAEDGSGGVVAAGGCAGGGAFSRGVFVFVGIVIHCSVVDRVVGVVRGVVIVDCRGLDAGRVCDVRNLCLLQFLLWLFLLW